MANTKRKSAPKATKNGTAGPIPFPASAETQTNTVEMPNVAENPPTASETTVEEQEIKRKGRPSKDGLSFFERLKTMPAAEWTNGQLVIYCYRFQPFTDRRFGGNKAVFLMKYTSPIDEQNVLLDHGSGVYHFKLNKAEEGQPTTYPIVTADLEIINRNFPPKIPDGEWVDDARNKKWAWAAPKGSMFHQQGQQEQQQPAANNPLEMLNTFVEIQDRMEERMRPAEAPDPVAQATAAVTLVDKVLALAKPAESGIPKYIETQLTALHTELAESRKRQDDLMDKLIDARTAAPKSDGLGSLKELLQTGKELITGFREMMPEGGVSATVTRREKEPWWTGLAEFGIEALKPAMPILAHGIMAFANRQPAPQINANKAITAGTEPAAPAATEHDIWPMLVHALEDEATGEDFAESVIRLLGKWKYQQACMLGEPGLLAFIQSLPVWQQLGPFQERMPQFIHEFVSYGQEPDESTPFDPDDEDTPPIPEAQGVNAAAQTIEL